MIGNDLNYLMAMASEIKSYLLSDELYWHASGTEVQGTVGGVLVRMRRLYPCTLSEEDQQRYRDAKTTIENALDEWMVQTEDKVKREIKTRLENWVRYVGELEDDPARYRDDWPNFAYQRTALRTLIEAKQDLFTTEQAELLAAADGRFRFVAEPAEFVWEEEMQPAFPQDDFWWLYAQPVDEPA